MNRRHFGITALVAFFPPVLLVGLALYGPAWISGVPYINDLTWEHVRAHGVPAWWHTFNFVWVLCLVAGLFYFRHRAKARR
jgi:hypothetical protein